MKLQEVHEMNVLLSFYKGLLTDRQRQYMINYYEDDFTLQEIADNYQISRQAVSDNIRRTEEALFNYEKELKLVRDFKFRKHQLEKLTHYIDHKYSTDRQLRQIVQELEDYEWGKEPS